MGKPSEKPDDPESESVPGYSGLGLSECIAAGLLDQWRGEPLVLVVPQL